MKLIHVPFQKLSIVVAVSSQLIKYHVWLTRSAIWCCVVIQITCPQGTGLRSPRGTVSESLTTPGWHSSVATRAHLSFPCSTERVCLGRLLGSPLCACAWTAQLYHVLIGS